MEDVGSYPVRIKSSKDRMILFLGRSLGQKYEKDNCTEACPPHCRSVTELWFPEEKLEVPGGCPGESRRCGSWEDT